MHCFEVGGVEVSPKNNLYHFEVHSMSVKRNTFSHAKRFLK